MVLDKRLPSKEKEIGYKEGDVISKKDPFSLGSKRFAPAHKVLLGPGSYSTPEANLKQGVRLKQT